MRHILYLERWRSVARIVLPSLQRHYEVTMTGTRREAFRHIEQESFDLVLIDVAAMKFNVKRFCGDLRTIAPQLPIFLLLREEDGSQPPCATDGTLKPPFNKRRLIYWLERAFPQPKEQLLEWHGLKLNPQRRMLRWQDKQVPLTPKRAALLQAFFKIPEETWPRGRLMYEVWGPNRADDTRTLEVHIYWLRQALKQLEAPFKIETRRGTGYRLVCLGKDS